MTPACAKPTATAYRNFQSRGALTTAVIDSPLGTVRSFSGDGLKWRERLHHLFKQTFPGFQEFEPQLRAAAQLAVRDRLHRAMSSVYGIEPYIVHKGI